MEHKIKSREELKEIISSLKKIGRRVVHTNGTYDLIHVGHINTLQKAKELGDILVVSINSDDSVKRYKGENRPIVGEKERAKVLAALESVNFVTIFNEDDILSTLDILKPSIHAKGGTFEPERIAKEKELIESLGGEFTILPMIEDKSTTSIIESILEKHEK